MRDGTWSFDDDGVRIVPGRERGVHKVRQDPDAPLRRLRELGGLRRDGILTEEEFGAAKAAVRQRFQTGG